ncbi:MAG: MFS transporter, partial [Acidimicrobiales bacterium]
GAIADVLDRRKLLAITAVLIALSTVGLAVNCIGNHPALWVLYLSSAMTWGLNGVDQPTRNAVLITLVDRKSYVPATALRQFISQASQVGGPALAGVLIAIFSRNLGIVYWIDVAATGAALCFVLRLSPLPRTEGTKFNFKAVAEGFRFLRGRQVIQACFITDINATLLGLPTSLYPYMAAVHFHGGAMTFGLLTASPGMGAVVGGILSGWTQHVKFPGRAVLIAVVFWGAAITCFGVTPWLWLAVISLAIAGWANAVSGVMRNTIIQMETPDQLRGRISGLASISVQVGKLGNVEAGLVAAVTNAEFSIVSGGLGCILGVIAVAKTMPNFAHYRLSHREQLPEPEAT